MTTRRESAHHVMSCHVMNADRLATALPYKKKCVDRYWSKAGYGGHWGRCHHLHELRAMRARRFIRKIAPTSPDIGPAP